MKNLRDTLYRLEIRNYFELSLFELLKPSNDRNDIVILMNPQICREYSVHLKWRKDRNERKFELEEWGKLLEW